jgi:hypothetical protein
MLTQAASVTLRILVFRAGPQDFPFGPGLGTVLIPLAVLANYLVLAAALPSNLLAAIVAATMVAGIGFATKLVLRARHLESRFAQTFHAQLATNAVLTLIMLMPMRELAPVLLQITQHPELLEQKPPAVAVPAGPVMIMNLVNIWTFAVSAHIFRHAANVKLWSGALLALLVSVALLLFVTFFASLLAAALGVSAQA